MQILTDSSNDAPNISFPIRIRWILFMRYTRSLILDNDTKEYDAFRRDTK